LSELRIYLHVAEDVHPACSKALNKKTYFEKFRIFRKFGLEAFQVEVQVGNGGIGEKKFPKEIYDFFGIPE
jgi:hypothetical protein